MDSRTRTDLDLVTGHILLIDIVGYSKMSALAQQESLHKLSQVIRNTDAGKFGDAEEDLPRLSTGSGLALVFASAPDAALRCAIQIYKGARNYSELKLRIGIHTGLVNRTIEPNDRLGIAGPGVNIARLVTDCGDTGHILLSRFSAEHLNEHWHWQPYLHDLGDTEIKPGEIISVVNFHKKEVGNPSLPKKFKNKNRKRSATADNVNLGTRPAQKTLLIILFFSVVAIAISYWILFPPGASHATNPSAGPEVQIPTGSPATPSPRAALLHP